MAKAKKEPKPRTEKYDPKLAVKGSFLDVIKASVKDAEKKSATKEDVVQVTDPGGLTAKKAK